MACMKDSLSDALDTNGLYLSTNYSSLKNEIVWRLDTMTAKYNVEQNGRLANTYTIDSVGKRRSRRGPKTKHIIMQLLIYLLSTITQLISLFVGAYKKKFVTQNFKIDILVPSNQDKQHGYSDTKHLYDELDNVQRLHTLAFPNRMNWHYYGLFAKEIVGDYFCKLTDIVCDCYILHSQWKPLILKPSCQSNGFRSRTVTGRCIGAHSVWTIV